MKLKILILRDRFIILLKMGLGGVVKRLNGKCQIYKLGSGNFNFEIKGKEL